MDEQLIQKAKELVIEAGLKLVKSGLVARTWGNISARVSDTHFVITPKGRGYETLKPRDIVLLKISDCSYEGDIKPSSEKGIHAAVYRYRQDVNFVIHTQQLNSHGLSDPWRRTACQQRIITHIFTVTLCRMPHMASHRQKKCHRMPRKPS
jgi:L-ribulose-5-phosphate 4-epimerase